MIKIFLNLMQNIYDFQNYALFTNFNEITWDKFKYILRSLEIWKLPESEGCHFSKFGNFFTYFCLFSLMEHIPLSCGSIDKKISV